MLEAIQFDFIQNALFAGLLASVVCGIIGSLVVVNRIVFLSGGIAHAAYGGIGISVFFGWPLMAGTLGFSLMAAALMAAVTLKVKHRADTVIGVLWATGMALGVIFLDLTPGYHVDLMSYLFGSILAVPRQQLWQLLYLGAGVFAVLAFFYKGFLAMAYDEEFAQLRGVPVRFLYFLLILMIALSVVLLIRIVGLILVIALLTIPPYIAERFSRSLVQMMVLSVLLNVLFTLTGLWLSYTYNLTSGPSIILVASVGFFLVVFISPLFEKWRRGVGSV